MLLSIDVCPAQRALTITYSQKGSGLYRTAVFSKLLANVAYHCQITQKLNTIHKIAEFYSVKFELIVKDRGSDIKSGVRMSLMADVETIDCLGGLLVDVLNYLESGLPLSKNGKTFNAPLKVQVFHKGISNVGYFENLSIVLKSVIDSMQPEEKDSELQRLSDLFGALHQKFKKNKLIDDLERDFLNSIIIELESWTIQGESNVLWKLRDEIAKCATLSRTESGLNYADGTVYETEKRHDSHRVKMSFRKKWELLRLYKGQYHSISKLQYKFNEYSEATRESFHKFIRCEKCGDVIIGKNNFRKHFLGHFPPDLKLVFRRYPNLKSN